MSEKQVRGQYTLEFKLEAVRQVKAGQSVAATAKVLGIPKASLSNWVRQSARAPIRGAGDKPAVTPEQMELARLRAEVARLTMERDIAKKTAAYVAQNVLRGTPGQLPDKVPSHRLLRVYNLTFAGCRWRPRS